MPPGGELPGAEGDGGVEVVQPISTLVAAAPARMLLAVRASLRLLEAAPFPRRFSHLPRARRTALLERMEGSRLGVRRDMLVLLKMLTSVGYARDPRVRAAIGVEQGCARANGAAPEAPDAPPLEPEELRAPEGVERCDVVIVGSGAGGAVAARALAELGVDVIVVEEGDYHDARSYADDPIAALPRLYRDAGLTFCEGRPVIPLPIGRAVGGTTVINSGTCFRTPDAVLASWRDEFGIPWADDLDGDFEALERDLHVTPLRAGEAGRNAELCRIGADAIGAANGPLARNARDVTRCATCPSGCAIDAKQAVHVSELPRAVAAGARIRAGARVRRVIVEGGRAVGVACDGYEVRSKAVLLAAGAVGTPELLLRQRLANSSGAVGRHLRIHPACWVGARFEEEVRGWDGVMQSWAVDEWRDRGLFLEATFTPLAFGAPWLRGAGERFKERLRDYGHLAVLGVHLSEHSSGGRVTLRNGSVKIAYRLSADDAKQIRYGIARAADVHFAAGATEVYPQVGRVASLAPGEQTRVIEQGRFSPAALRLEAFHPMGTARMAADPRHSVVGPTGEAHDLPGLFVADASVLPTALGVNPMITIMACARRVAAQLAATLDRAPATVRSS